MHSLSMTGNEKHSDWSAFHKLRLTGRCYHFNTDQELWKGGGALRHLEICVKKYAACERPEAMYV